MRVPSADQHQFVGGAVQPAREAQQVVQQMRRRQPHLGVRRAQDARQLRHHRPEIDAVGVGLRPVERQPAGVIAVAVPERTGAQAQVQDPLGDAAIVVPADRRAVEALGETR